MSDIPAKFLENPVLVSVFNISEATPGLLDVGDELTLGRHIGWASCQAQLGLQGAVVCLQVSLLLKLGRVFLGLEGVEGGQLLEALVGGVEVVTLVEAHAGGLDPLEQI